MISRKEAEKYISQLSHKLQTVFPDESFDVILYGSYARNEEEDGSDIDVMYLVDSSRQEIAEKNWQIGEAASEILLDSGIVISPIVENRSYYLNNAEVLPFFRNVNREGVRIGA